VFTSKTKKTTEVPPTTSITNAQYCKAVYYAMKKSELLDDPNCSKVKMFLTNKKKYEDIQASPEKGDLLPGDRWEALGTYLQVEQGPLVVEGQELLPVAASHAREQVEQVVQHLPDETVMKQQQQQRQSGGSMQIRDRLHHHFVFWVPPRMGGCGDGTGGQQDEE
jgi:hypothetical protein